MAERGTDTVLGARDHARAQAGTAEARAVTTQPTVPATAATDLPDGVAAADVVWDETLGLGGYASRVLRRGTHLRLADLTGDTNLHLVLHHAARPAERLNVADTVKLQWNAYLGGGGLLLSDMGRVLATMLPGSTAALDLLCGASTRSGVAARHGDSGNHSPTPAGRDRLLLGLAKHGLGRRDLPPSANLFSSVRVEPDGSLVLAPPGEPSHMTLRCELDVLVTVAVTPHVLDDRPTYTGGPVRLTAWSGAPAGPDDPARAASPEARRAFENTDDVLSALVGAGVGSGLGPEAG
ncbi:MAG TPA: urea amidolyase associated protein UAAP1 [Acidimicrobiales bacterium]